MLNLLIFGLNIKHNVLLLDMFWCCFPFYIFILFWLFIEVFRLHNAQCTMHIISFICNLHPIHVPICINVFYYWSTPEHSNKCSLPDRLSGTKNHNSKLRSKNLLLSLELQFPLKRNWFWKTKLIDTMISGTYVGAFISENVQ